MNSLPAGKYRNPPIEEAICEFTFAAAGPVSQMDLTLPGRIQSHPAIKDEYCGQAHTQTVQTILSNEVQPGMAVQTSILRIQLPNLDGTRILGIGSNSLSISILKPYEGWTNFRPRIERALTAYIETAKPLPITRVGVRYVNRIVIQEPNVSADTYLSDINSRHKKLRGTVSSFLHRTEYKHDDGIKIITTQATLNPMFDKGTEYLLDIDAVMDTNLPVHLADVLLAADKLHAAEGEAFEALITDKSRMLFDAI